MARGWESKSVEDQQLEHDRPKARRGPAEDPARAQRRQSLELALARTRADLARARNEAHRQMLERALGELERQLRELGPDPLSGEG